jgi:glycosidase
MEIKKGNKIVIYQIFSRLFGNENSNCIHNGSIEENGCGKFSDFTTKALNEIKKLGITHIWYTGVIEHATQTDYSKYNIRQDHPVIVKGKAGSPYAIKDYYDVDPDLADDVPNRMNEFEALVERTHQSDLKFIIDFVPNHVARQYNSDSKPKQVKDLGEDDNTENAFSPYNNFYYIPQTMLNGQFEMKGNTAKAYYEFPAKATGNDKFDAYPGVNDWYETVKLNYGIDYANGGTRHFYPVPDTWLKMLDILLFWASKGIDGFRCDMAEMVPVEFWKWAIAQVRYKFPGIIFIAEVYKPEEYHNYLFNGGFNYLYDKVGLYETIRDVTCGYKSASDITPCWQILGGIEKQMLNFLENHDEQRIASSFFARDGFKGIPGMIVSACINVNPVMIYFGQEFGEEGMDEEGFSGRDGRTTIFDYWSIKSIRNWKNNNEFDGKDLTDKQRRLQAFYKKLLNLCNEEKAIYAGQFFDLMYANFGKADFNVHKQYTFFRKQDNELLLIIANFDQKAAKVSINIPSHAFDFLQIPQKESYLAKELLTGNEEMLSLLPYSPTETVVEGMNGKILKFIL